MEMETAALVRSRSVSLSLVSFHSCFLPSDPQVRQLPQQRQTPCLQTASFYSLIFAKQITAAEDLTTLTRAMKEAWIFGRLDTLGAVEAEKRAAEEARKVAGLLREFADGEANEGKDGG